MTLVPWRLGAVDLAARIARQELSCRQATTSVLERIGRHNGRINAIADVMGEDALAAADRADRCLERGDPVGPLHGVPITIKVNVDTAGRATTDGVVACRDHIATADSPLVAHLRAAGAVIVGRTNTPAFSLRWFTDNDLHGRTLNPFDAGVTPGGSSGGAAAATAMGMGAIAHGNDYGGSIRYPAWACGVVGLRTTVGRIPSYSASAPTRPPTQQMMSVQGPLTRSVADARLALQVMAQGSPFDPQWVDAPLAYPQDAQRPLKVAMFKRHPAFDADPSVVAAISQAAAWLAAAGYEVEEIEPPHFEESAQLWRQLVMDDARRSTLAEVERLGDAASGAALRNYMAPVRPLDRDQTLDALARRFDIARDWAVFLDQHPVLLMPNSWQRQFANDSDDTEPAQVEQMVRAQSPLLATALLGLPGLSVPTGLSAGLPTGVQLVAGRFREDLALRAGAHIERAAGFSALDELERRLG
ncbi:amidase [Ideonella sp. A 288]|uniref:amidase n=1 Tax=Ideonella sp. A 288 TaxID=1962181 RepID=UPI000B4AE084|nr:amidase [Ideonella sp. A 288]